MKLLYSLTLIPLLLLSVSATAQWTHVGNPGFSGNTILYPSLALDANCTPYVAYRDESNSSKATVMKYDGANWGAVGNAGFSTWQANYTSIAIDRKGIIYVAYSDGIASNKATVMKYNGTSWTLVGSQGFTPNTAGYTYIAVDTGDVPYLAYGDGLYGGNATVVKFDGSNWMTVGSPGFSAGQASFISMKFDENNTPYIGYQDVGSNFKATVMKFNGSNWMNVGNAGISAGPVNYTSLALHPDGTPYISYQDISNGLRATVMKYNGTHWVSVGNPAFSADTVYTTSLVVNENGIPFIAFEDMDYNHKVTVMRYTGNDWSVVGSAGFSAGGTNFPTLATGPGCGLYVAYGDYMANFKSSVMKYDCPTQSKVAICAATTDSATGKNIIVWNGSSLPKVDSYRVYRLQGSSYAQIGSVPGSAYFFTDATANGGMQSYTYRLTVLDSCGREMALDSSAPHTTMKLSFNYLLNGVASVSWNSYTGIPNVTYTVKHSNNGGPFTTIAAFQISGSDTTYLDGAPPTGSNVYRVDVALANPCGGYEKITSNMVMAWHTGIKKVSDNSSVWLVPNPAYRSIAVKASEPITELVVFSLTGKKLMHRDFDNRKEVEIDISALPAGMYSLMVNGALHATFVKH